MKHILLPMAIAAPCLVSCESIDLNWNRDTPRVDDAYIAEMDEAQRAEVNELRADAQNLRDELAAIDLRIEREHEAGSLADKELEIAEDAQDLVERQAEIAVPDPDQRAEEYADELDAARAHVRWAEAQIAYQDARVEAARAERDLTKRKLEALEARVELKKAQAVTYLEDDGALEVDVHEYERVLEEAEALESMAEIDFQTAQQKAEARREFMNDIADEVPVQSRDAWRVVDAGRITRR